MEEHTETDVLVVGAGPIGMTVAALLADYGMNVVLAEKEATTSDSPRAISVTDETLRVMAEIGVLEELVPEMLMDTGARYFGRRGQLLAEVRPGRPRLGQPGKSQFDQPVMESLLLDAVRRRPAIDVRFEAEVLSLTDHGSGVETLIHRHGALSRVRSKWVLACDGGRSPIRTRLGITLEGSTQAQQWIVVDIADSKVKAERFAEFHCNGTRPVVQVPGAKGRRRYEFMLLPGERAEDVTTAEFIAGLVAPYESVEPESIRRAAVYVAHQRIAAEYRRGRVILAGDAAHLMPPFAGQALNAGVRDAANLAWKIAAQVNGAPEALLNTYAAERRPHTADMVRLSHLIGQVVMATNPLVAAARDGLLAATSLVPPLNRWITQMRFLRQPHYTEGCLVPPARGMSGPAAELVGRALAQPVVRDGDGSESGLDAVLGRGWSRLRFPGANRIEVVPVGEAAAEHRTLQVTDTEGAFGDLPAGTELLIRPDRYVAAAFQSGGASAVLAQLAELVPELGRTGSTAARNL
ncbi:MAG: FAD-dependent monooxygenase [Arthrobacter sp.]